MLSTGDSNDAAMLVPELLVLILRSLKSLKPVLVIHTLNLEQRTK